MKTPADSEIRSLDDLRSEMACLEAKLARVIEAEFDEDVVNMVQADLAEAKAAMQQVLEHGEESLPRLIAGKSVVWHTYRRKLKKVTLSLDSLL